MLCPWSPSVKLSSQLEAAPPGPFGLRTISHIDRTAQAGRPHCPLTAPAARPTASNLSVLMPLTGLCGQSHLLAIDGCAVDARHAMRCETFSSHVSCRSWRQPTLYAMTSL